MKCREEKDMPEYVSYVSLTLREKIYGNAKESADNFIEARRYVKTDNWKLNENGKWTYNNNRFNDLSFSYLPATKEQFESYQSTQIIN